MRQIMYVHREFKCLLPNFSIFSPYEPAALFNGFRTGSIRPQATPIRTASMNDLCAYQAKRETLRQKYIGKESVTSKPANLAGTGGVDHLAMISSDIEQTIEFYTGVLGMTVTDIIQNRDEPSSTHVFLDMGGGNSMAFFDFPKHGDTPVVRGIGAMHHVALKATPEQYKGVIANLKAREHMFNIHGDEERGSVYFHDPDDILLEVRSEDNERRNE